MKQDAGGSSMTNTDSGHGEQSGDELEVWEPSLLRERCTEEVTRILLIQCYYISSGLGFALLSSALLFCSASLRGVACVASCEL